MVYVMLANWKSGLSREQQDGALMRRAQWEYPSGVQLKGEYWPASTAPAVISIFEADGFSPLQEISLVWGDVFDITILPATTPEDGLRSGQEIMQRLGAGR